MRDDVLLGVLKFGVIALIIFLIVVSFTIRSATEKARVLCEANGYEFIDIVPDGKLISSSFKYAECRKPTGEVVMIR